MYILRTFCIIFLAVHTGMTLVLQVEDLLFFIFIFILCVCVRVCVVELQIRKV